MNRSGVSSQWHKDTWWTPSKSKWRETTSSVHPHGSGTGTHVRKSSLTSIASEKKRTLLKELTTEEGEIKGQEDLAHYV